MADDRWIAVKRQVPWGWRAQYSIPNKRSRTTFVALTKRGAIQLAETSQARFYESPPKSWELVK